MRLNRCLRRLLPISHIIVRDSLTYDLCCSPDRSFFSAVSPRDEIARVSGIEVHERGGVIVDDLLRTNDEDIFAIGEVALHG